MERNFAHQFDTGGMDRPYVRGRGNVHKKLLIQAAACNLALLLRALYGAGVEDKLRFLPGRGTLDIIRSMGSSPSVYRAHRGSFLPDREDPYLRPSTVTMAVPKMAHYPIVNGAGTLGQTRWGIMPRIISSRMCNPPLQICSNTDDNGFILKSRAHDSET